MLVTGAGAGLGRAYSLMLGRLGAKVVVNDMSAKNADAVVQEVKSGMPPLLPRVSQGLTSPVCLM